MDVKALQDACFERCEPDASHVKGTFALYCSFKGPSTVGTTAFDLQHLDFWRQNNFLVSLSLSKKVTLKLFYIYIINHPHSPLLSSSKAFNPRHTVTHLQDTTPHHQIRHSFVIKSSWSLCPFWCTPHNSLKTHSFLILKQDVCNVPQYDEGWLLSQSQSLHNSAVSSDPSCVWGQLDKTTTYRSQFMTC